MPIFDSTSHYRKLADLYCADEDACLRQLFGDASLPPEKRAKASTVARRWIENIRQHHRPQLGPTDLLSRFGLTTDEGLALMCLAEALLRIPDTETVDALIKDKLTEADWNHALGGDASWALSAAGWALAATGRILELDNPGAKKPGAMLGNLISHLGQPVIREAIRHAMQWLADQFVTGQSIRAALERVKPDMERGVRFSFDMLGEGARSAADASRYMKDYVDAVETVGIFQATHRFAKPSGISVKLSALHPRYEMVQRDRVLREMVPGLVLLCETAAKYNIPLTIDAEEADRLQLSLEVAEAILRQAKLVGWEGGLGFAVQAYQKRAPLVIDTLADLARSYNRRIHIRLVKGAYWDTEIKRVQERGFDDFPVYTRKTSTDISYLACARRMLAHRDLIEPLFGTHNAMTVAHILQLVDGDVTRVEFQRLHGMGDELYALMQEEGINCCVYAPVGNHEVLLGYLVRRILENGANSSFVHRLMDKNIKVEELIADPVSEIKTLPTARHPLIRRPEQLYLPLRQNSSGVDISEPFTAAMLLKDVKESLGSVSYHCDSIVDGKQIKATPEIIENAFVSAEKGYRKWALEAVEKRAAILERLAKLLEGNREGLVSLLVSEGRKTVGDALAEIREAVDYCYYYGARVLKDFVPVDLPGPTGETNTLTLVGRGVFVCISPWNFPLAIFLGQILAALAAGNAVIAKPAPQTPCIAVATSSLIHAAGIPCDVFHLLTGGPEIGAVLVKHRAVAGIAFTGSTATGRAINRALAAKEGPIVPLIAETGGQNALIVDSSALPEQVVDDVITSSFRSAGQRCSALRVLYLPEATADKILTMLKGAMQELRVGDPAKLETDVGPVIDKDARDKLLAHVARLKAGAKEIFTTAIAEECAQDTFVAPQAWEIPAIDWLTGEVFGPILHVIRYKPENLSAIIQEINATGFGLTGGVHSRIESTVEKIERELHVGNLYINRSIIGAVVGVQPFGGEGLSGTGPKAGGPHYLPRFAQERVVSNNITASGGNASLLAAASEDTPPNP